MTDTKAVADVGRLTEKFEEIRALLGEAYGFKSTSPAAQDNINGALESLDAIEREVLATRAPVVDLEGLELARDTVLRKALQLMVDRFGPCEKDYIFSKRYAIQKARAALAAAPEQAVEAAAPSQSKPTDLSRRLRAKASQPFGPEDFELLTQAADEIERYYGGMLAWKHTAEAKDAEFRAAPPVQGNVPEAVRALIATPSTNGEQRSDTERDAARYRWLRVKRDIPHGERNFPWVVALDPAEKIHTMTARTDVELDAAIDIQIARAATNTTKSTTGEGEQA